MKPVQLIPEGTGSLVAAPIDAGPVRPVSANGAIGILAGGLVALAITGYFEFAAHSNAKTRASDIVTQTADATNQTNAVMAQITDKSGAVNDWSGTAQTVASTVISTVGQRKDYSAFMRDLRNVVTPDLGIWLNSVDTGGAVDASGTPTSGQVTIAGHAPTWAALNALQVRLNATSTMSNAQIATFTNELSRQHKQYIRFTMTVQLDQPGSSGSAGSSDGGTTVGSSSGGETATDIAIDPEPGYGRKVTKAKQQAVKAAPKPKSAMELAIEAAGKAGGSK